MTAADLNRQPDGNPEAILIQTPLDNTDNPKNFRLGDTLQDISGVSLRRHIDDRVAMVSSFDGSCWKRRYESFLTLPGHHIRFWPVRQRSF